MTTAPTLEARLRQALRHCGALGPPRGRGLFWVLAGREKAVVRLRARFRREKGARRELVGGGGCEHGARGQTNESGACTGAASPARSRGSLPSSATRGQARTGGKRSGDEGASGTDGSTAGRGGSAFPAFNSTTGRTSSR